MCVLSSDYFRISGDVKLLFQIQSNLSLAGTEVLSDAPVAVLSGSQYTTIGSSQIQDFTIESMIPVEFLGTDYLVPSVETSGGYALQITGLYYYHCAYN